MVCVCVYTGKGLFLYDGEAEVAQTLPDLPPSPTLDLELSAWKKQGST